MSDNMIVRITAIITAAIVLVVSGVFVFAALQAERARANYKTCLTKGTVDDCERILRPYVTR